MWETQDADVYIIVCLEFWADYRVSILHLMLGGDEVVDKAWGCGLYSEERSAGFLFFILLFYDPWWVSWGKRRAGILKNETHILFFKTASLQTILSFDLNDFLVKMCSMFNNFFIVDQNIMKSRVHPYSLKAFQRFQECKKRHYDFGDMSMTRMQEEAIWFWRYQHDQQTMKYLYCCAIQNQHPILLKLPKSHMMNI